MVLAKIARMIAIVALVAPMITSPCVVRDYDSTVVSQNEVGSSASQSLSKHNDHSTHSRWLPIVSSLGGAAIGGAIGLGLTRKAGTSGSTHNNKDANLLASFTLAGGIFGNAIGGLSQWAYNQHQSNMNKR